MAYLVVGFDVQLDLFAGEGADSRWGRIGQLYFLEVLVWMEKMVEEEGDLLDLHDGRGWLVVVVVCRGRWVGGGGGVVL